MKAAYVTDYDKKSINLTLGEAPKPEPQGDQVLVRVLTAGINPLDNMISRGEVKLITPYKLPQIGGNELVGIVESLRQSKTTLKVGDRVFGRLPLQSIGAFADYVAVEAKALAKVPDYLTDIEAAAVPLTALTAMQALDLMEAKSGQSIFISGGTGGVGALAIPLAKARGLRVITNGSAQNRERVLELGADLFLDYRSQDYTRELSDIDHVLDTLGGDETTKQMQIVRPGGHIVSLRALPNAAFARRMGLAPWKRLLFSLAGRQLDRQAKRLGITYDFIFVESNGQQLEQVADIMTELRIKPSIDSVFPFSDLNRALDKVAKGSSRGKTVLQISERQ